MNEIKKILDTLLPHESFDALAVGIIDFGQKSFESYTAYNEVPHINYYFDLASLTKPLVNSLSYFLKPDSFDAETLLCLSHRGGLPAWGLLPQDGWKEIISGYPVKESETLYSDFSALRVLLNLAKKGVDQKKVCSEVWDVEMVNWLDLPLGAPTLQTGYKNGLPNFSQVHDPNAWVINEFCSHAGMFSTIGGVCRTLLNYEAKTGFLNKVQADLSKHKHRFALGWDRVENPENTLAGAGCGKFTFGHLGFTGTSIWIDPEKKLGHVILSNAVKDYWYHKQGLNDIRRAVGEQVWKLK